MYPIAHGDNPPPEVVVPDLSKYIFKDGDHPVTRGGFVDIWKCFYIDRILAEVTVKVLQVCADDLLGPAKTKKTKRIIHELRICANLNHANIVPIYGYTYGFGPFPAIVSHWAERGNLSDYLKREGAALTLLRKFRIGYYSWSAISYVLVILSARPGVVIFLTVHTNNVIHGDFTGSNVLIYGDGTACIADFGLSLMYSEVVSTSQASWTSTFSGNSRWMASELLGEREDGTPVRPSKQSDVFSFGGIMLLVLTNKIPYYYLRHNYMVVLHISRSERPSRIRYPELPEKYWPFIEQCWSTDPRDHPSMEEADVMIRNEIDSLSRIS